MKHWSLYRLDEVNGDIDALSNRMIWYYLWLDIDASRRLREKLYNILTSR
jgi:hypothetical protein